MRASRSAANHCSTVAQLRLCFGADTLDKVSRRYDSVNQVHTFASKDHGGVEIAVPHCALTGGNLRFQPCDEVALAVVPLVKKNHDAGHGR